MSCPHSCGISLRRHALGKPNFSFQKRQKELAKKKKNEEKRQRKLEKNAAGTSEDQQAPAEASPDDNNGMHDRGI